MNRKVTVFTYIDRNSFFLDKWLEYYSSIFTQDELLILYKPMTDFDLYSYLDEKGLSEINVVEIDGNKQSFTQEKDLFNNFQKELLKSNDVVLYSDIDEIIFHPKLRDVINTFTFDYLTCTGFEIIQHKKEFGLYTDQPIMKQRSHGMFSDWYNKPLIVQKPLEWTLGKHNFDTTKLFWKDLFLIHLNKVDFSILNELNIQNNELYKDVNKHNSLIDIDLLDHFETNLDPNLVKLPIIVKNNLKI